MNIQKCCRCITYIVAMMTLTVHEKCSLSGWRMRFYENKSLRLRGFLYMLYMYVILFMYIYTICFYDFFYCCGEAK